MLEALKERVYQANLTLPEHGLVKFTWGNVSEIDREAGLFVIKPSGVPYSDMKVSDMVVCDLEGNIIEGDFNPSSDMLTHAVLYQHFQEIGGIVHTHSSWATIWSQAGLALPAMGTTHADTFYGEVPCARYLTKEEIDTGYEWNTGEVIVQTFQDLAIDPMAVPAVLLHGHAPFTWGKDAWKAVENAVILEEVAKLNFYTRQLNTYASPLPQMILDKHYLRKHGKDAYYGQ